MSECTKPNCDCMEQEAKKQGIDVYQMKHGYPCLKRAELNDLAALKANNPNSSNRLADLLTKALNPQQDENY